MKFILGKKIEMTQLFKEDGTVVPVTLVNAECDILQVKNNEKDGYQAVKLGFERLPERKIKKSGTPFRHLREFRVDDISNFKAGDKILASVFQPGDIIKVSGTSKGKGFQGGVKRYGFSGKLSSSHGNKHEHRTIGSVGCAVPARVLKGKRMPGRMGSERISVKNLEVASIDAKNNIIAIKGAVPGRRGTLLEIRTK